MVEADEDDDEDGKGAESAKSGADVDSVEVDARCRSLASSGSVLERERLSRMTTEDEEDEERERGSSGGSTDTSEMMDKEGSSWTGRASIAFTFGPKGADAPPACAIRGGDSGEVGSACGERIDDGVFTTSMLVLPVCADTGRDALPSGASSSPEVRARTARTPFGTLPSPPPSPSSPSPASLSTSSSRRFRDSAPPRGGPSSATSTSGVAAAASMGERVVGVSVAADGAPATIEAGACAPRAAEETPRAAPRPRPPRPAPPLPPRRPPPTARPTPAAPPRPSGGEDPDADADEMGSSGL